MGRKKIQVYASHRIEIIHIQEGSHIEDNVWLVGRARIASVAIQAAVVTRWLVGLWLVMMMKKILIYKSGGENNVRLWLSKFGHVNN
jgi:hypothetical protein